MKQVLCRQDANCDASFASFSSNAFPKIPRNYGINSGEPFAAIANFFSSTLVSSMKKTSCQHTLSRTASSLSTNNYRPPANVFMIFTYALHHSPLTSSPPQNEGLFSKNYPSIELSCGIKYNSC